MNLKTALSCIEPETVAQMLKDATDEKARGTDEAAQVCDEIKEWVHAHDDWYQRRFMKKLALAAPVGHGDSNDSLYSGLKAIACKPNGMAPSPLGPKGEMYD